MKLILTLLVRDEEDILQANIDFHLSQGVDHIIATDNLSVDATRDILKTYEARGVLTYLHETRDTHDQHAWVTRMARMAYSDYQADWVINCDADEFWWPKTGSLKTAFEKTDLMRDWPRLGLKYNAWRVSLDNFICLRGLPDQNQPFYEQMIYRKSEKANMFGGPLATKLCHRGSDKVRVREGNHDVKGIRKRILEDDGIEILHFPVRSYKQFLQKVINGGSSYERNTVLPERLGSHLRYFYKEYKQTGDLRQHFEKISFEYKDLEQALVTGRLMQDTRLRDYMRGLRSG